MKKLLFVIFIITCTENTCYAQQTSNPKDSIVFKGTTCYSYKRTSNPLILLNNRKVGKQKLKRLNEKDIVSITVLKDASSILPYGKRGRYGVILIKTKFN